MARPLVGVGAVIAGVEGMRLEVGGSIGSVCMEVAAADAAEASGMGLENCDERSVSRNTDTDDETFE